MEPIIRWGETTDYQRCREIEVAGDRLFVEEGHLEFVAAEPATREAFEVAVREQRLLIAEADERIAGWAMTDRCGHELYLVQISVEPALQRRGIGRVLMNRVISDAGSAEEPSIVLNTQGDIAWNRPFYETFGFVVVPPKTWTVEMAEQTARQIEAGFDWSTRVHMRLTLGSSGPEVVHR